MKKTVTLSKKELNRIPILEEISSGVVSESEGADRMGISTRQTRRLLRKYEKGGGEALAHQLRGCISNRSISYDETTIKGIVTSDLFSGFKPGYASEKLLSLYDITISKESLRKLMIEWGVWEANHIKQVPYRMRRPRMKRYGVMIQFDGSYHDWLENGEIYCLLVAIDDATGNLVEMLLGDNEGFDCVGRFWKSYIKQHGVPEKLYIDKFSTYKVNYPKATNEKDMKTHFSRAMQEVGCEVIHANSPQAKGRVERANQTLQDRLIKEMRLHKIKTVQDANKFIKEIYIPYHNQHFGVQAQEQGNAHHSCNLNLDRVFTRRYMRTVSNDMCVQYENRYYQILQGDYKVMTKMSIEVREAIGGEIHLNLRDKTLLFEEISSTEVRVARAKKRNKIRLQKELQQREREEAQQNERHKISKQKQLLYQQKRLLN